MRLKGIVWGILIGAGITAQAADDLARQVRDLELRGQVQEARQALEAAAKAQPGNVETLGLYAAFLDERRDPQALSVYEKIAALAPEGSAGRTRALARITVLNLIHGRQAEARRSLEAWRRAGGSGWELRDAAQAQALPMGTVTVPGPLASFARMAAFSPEMPPQEILLALARNVITNGYQALSGNEGMEQTEYLKLVIRYLSQARELERLAGPDRVIRIEQCESPQTAELLRVLGLRMRGGCGSDVVLETVNATRAFLSMDSGFPLAELEQALRTNRPFVYDYKPAEIPVLYSAEYW
ncbi:MAG: tetratricopeptide repeat protein, partial [Bryobacteraceae bacterium]